MLVAIIGESCTGKSTLAAQLKEILCCEVVVGKDYLRMAKNEAIARKLFQKQLAASVTGAHLIYVISEQEHLNFLPEGTLRVLMTADISLIQNRFSQRMHGILPPAVKQMLDRKHGCFDGISWEYHIHNNQGTEEVCRALQKME